MKIKTIIKKWIYGYEVEDDSIIIAEEIGNKFKKTHEKKLFLVVVGVKNNRKISSALALYRKHNESTIELTNNDKTVDADGYSLACILKSWRDCCPVSFRCTERRMLSLASKKEWLAMIA